MNAVIEKAAYIYRKALEKGLVRGSSISALIASALYAACRDTETPRTLKDIGQASNIKRKDIARCYRLLLRELNLKMPVVILLNVFQELQVRQDYLKKQKGKPLKYSNCRRTKNFSRKRSNGICSSSTLCCMCYKW